jgi:hypothetical protein
MGKRIVFVFIVIALIAGTGWALYHFKLIRRGPGQSQYSSSNFTGAQDPDAWNRAVEIAKADRGDAGAGALEIPPELKHYEERHWFLATQVAEIEKYKVHTCLDYLDLAAMIERGEMVPVPAVTDTYVLFGGGRTITRSVVMKKTKSLSIRVRNHPKRTSKHCPNTTRSRGWQKVLMDALTISTILRTGLP